MADSTTDMRRYENRLESFVKQEPPAKKARTAAAKNIPNAWPHETPTVEQMASAGFYYAPTSNSVDNVKCFHCQVKLDGWEIDDNPVLEHISHQGTCEWAVAISTQLPNEDRDPMSEKLLNARLETFGGAWPHDKKRNWKPKSKKLAEAGWTCDLSASADDGVTCFYCQISLDEWDRTDDPAVEHRKRQPDCLFFHLVERYASSRPKKYRARGNSTASKASRLSTQSVQSTFSEAPSFMSLGENAPILDGETSIGTITSTTSVAKGKKKASTKKGGRPKKKAADDTTEMETALSNILGDDTAPQSARLGLQDTHMEDIKEESTIDVKTEPLKKTTRGKSRGKKAAAETAVVEKTEDQIQSQSEVVAATMDSAPKKPAARAKRGKKRTSDGEEKFDIVEPAQELAVPSTQLDLPDVEPVALSKGKKGKAAKGKKTKVGHEEDVASTQTAANKDAMETISVHTEVEEAVARPQRSRKPKATEAVKEPTPEPVQQAEPEPEPEPSIEDESANYMIHPGEDESEANYIVHDESSANFIVHGQTPPPAEFEPTPTPQKAAPPREDVACPPALTTAHSSPVSVNSTGSAQSSDAENRNPSFTRESRPITSSGYGSSTILPPAPSPPAAITATTPPRPQLSPTKTIRVPLAAETPKRSPSKLSPTKLGHLKSSHPWTATDIETIFFAADHEAGKEDAMAPAGNVAGKMKALAVELDSPEKEMTVEQWIYHQARKGEEKLRDECERLVWLFEQEGVRALRTLEGVKVRVERWDESILA